MGEREEKLGCEGGRVGEDSWAWGWGWEFYHLLSILSPASGCGSLWLPHPAIPGALTLTCFLLWPCSLFLCYSGSHSLTLSCSISSPPFAPFLIVSQSLASNVCLIHR